MHVGRNNKVQTGEETFGCAAILLGIGALALCWATSVAAWAVLAPVP